MFKMAGNRLAICRLNFGQGSVVLFYNRFVPIGWSKITTQNDKTFRVVSGSTGGTAGGTNAFSTVMAQTTVANRTLTTATVASHQHDVRMVTTGGIVGWVGGGNSAYVDGTSGSTGSDGSHSHSVTMSVKYINMILAQRS